MKKHSRFIPILAFIMLTIFGSMLACRFNFDEREIITTTSEQYYSIDPQSLLNDTSLDDPDAFVPIESEPEFPPASQQIPVKWNQSDYWIIANGVFEKTWGESSNGWHLNKITYRLGCNKVDLGFQQANFTFFKNMHAQEREYRIVRYISIDPRSKAVYTWESEYSPRLTDWKIIDLAQLHISATDALQIAENNGGEQTRLSIENECNITISLSPDSARYRGWEVGYGNKDDAKLFRIQVDPQSGKVHFP